MNLNRKVGLVEKFYSIQGEGANVGRASLFIRFAGCNLDCVFADGSICDTPWRSSNEKVTIQELVDWVEEHDHGEVNPWYKPMVILTGGEPTMSPAFDDLVRILTQRGHHVAVETNGTIWKTAIQLLYWLVVSPKDDIHHNKPLADSPEVHPEILNRRVDEFRYVITDRDSPAPPYLPGKTHFVSPATLADGSGLEHLTGFPGFVPGAVERCVEIVKNDPRWRLSLQTHKVIGAR